MNREELTSLLQRLHTELAARPQVDASTREALQTLDRLALLGDTLPVLGLLRAQGLLAAGRKEEAQIEMAQFLARRLENET